MIFITLTQCAIAQKGLIYLCYNTDYKYIIFVGD